MASITRRQAARLVAGTAAAGFGLKAPAVWSQANMTKIRVGVVPVMDAGAFIAAQAQGYFAAERLEVEVTPTPGGGPAMAAVVADQFQLAMSTITTMIAGVGEGVDLRVVAPTTIANAPPNDYTSILVRKDGSVRSGADTAGKIGASHLLQNLLWICLRMWVDQTGGDSSKGSSSRCASRSRPTPCSRSVSITSPASSPSCPPRSRPTPTSSRLSPVCAAG